MFVNLKYFKNIDLEQLDNYYEDEMADKQLSVEIDLNFSKKSINVKKLDIVKHVLSGNPSDISLEMISLLKSIPDHESITLYKTFIEEEFEINYESVEVFLDTLQLNRIGFYPEAKDSVVVFDIKPKDLEIDHLLCMQMNKKTMIVDISIES